MANQFDITPADPLQAQQDWRQSLAKTAVLESTAAQQPGIQQKQRMELQALMQASADDTKFRAEAAKLSPDMPLTDRVASLATLAFQTGKLGDGEKLLSAAANIANKESQAAVRTQAISLKSAQELAKKIAVYQSVEQMMAESPLGWEMGNQYIKKQTATAENPEGENHPLYAEPDGKPRQWTPELGKALNAGHTKRLSGLQEQEAQARIENIRLDNVRADKVAAAQIAANEALVRVRDEKRAAAGKAGAGRLATVNKSEILQALNVVKNLKPEASPEDQLSFATDVAQDAKDILIREHGSFKDAVAKAAEKNMGNWKESAPTKVLGIPLIGTGGKPKYEKAPVGVPKVGTVDRGYKFNGGDPSKPASWTKVTADEGED